MYQDDIQPASVDQILRGRDGKFITIESDVGGVVKQIQGINKDFRVRWSEAGEYFVVYYRDPSNGDEDLVTTAQELDHRLLKRIQKISNEKYSYVDELEEIAKKTKKNREYIFGEQIKEHGEKIAHAIRKDLGVERDVARSRKAWGKGLRGH